MIDQAWVQRLRRLLPALWLGMLLCIAGIATPAPFALLERGEAGKVAGRILAQEAWLSLVLALLLLAIERARARQRFELGQGSVLSTEMLLLLGTVFCTVAGYFGIQTMLPAARAGQGALTFGQLHLVSTLFFGLKIVLLAMLAWRGAQATGADLSRPPSS